jgi:hypothetical protein
MPLLEAGKSALRLDRVKLARIPLPRGDAESWVRDFWSAAANDLTHLIAIERAGPSHTLHSLAQQGADRDALAAFERDVPIEHRDVCHNIRGTDITAWTAPAHLLFESAAKWPAVTTIGIGDGGNEIGMGSFSWGTLVRAIARGPAALVPCRIPADHTIVAGVSNWGGYALALAVASLRSATGCAWTLAEEGRLIETLVREAGAVDGVTKRKQATVDGLPLQEYLHVLRDLRAAVGLSP